MIDLMTNSITTQHMLREMVKKVEEDYFPEDLSEEARKESEEYFIEDFIPSVSRDYARQLWDVLKEHLFDDERMFCLSVYEQYVLDAVIKYYWNDIFGDADHLFLDDFPEGYLLALSDFAGIFMETVEVTNYLLHQEEE